MTPPISIDGTDITGATIDGTDVQEITVDGDVVFTAAPPIPGSVNHYYPTNEGSGTVLTDTVGSTNATISGAAWQTGAGTANTFLSYDGSNDFTDFNNPSSPLIPETDDFTGFIWVRPDSGGQNNIILSQYFPQLANGRLSCSKNNDDEFSLFLGNDNSESSVSIKSTTTTNIGEWYSVAIRRDGNDFDLFVNGQLEGSHTDSGTRNILQTGNLIGAETALAGSYNQDLHAFFSGAVDQFWIDSNTALSNTVIEDFHDDTVGLYP